MYAHARIALVLAVVLGTVDSALCDEQSKTWLYSTPEGSVTLKTVSIVRSPKMVVRWEKRNAEFKGIESTFSLSWKEFVETYEKESEQYAFEAVFVFENKTARKRMKMQTNESTGTQIRQFLLYSSLFSMTDDVGNRYSEQFHDSPRLQDVPPRLKVEQALHFECPPDNTESVVIKMDSEAFWTDSANVFDKPLEFDVEWSKVEKRKYSTEKG